MRVRGALVLSVAILVAAAPAGAAPTESVGTAATSMEALSVAVTGPVEASVILLQNTTEVTSSDGVAATASSVPLTLNGEAQGGATATLSDPGPVTTAALATPDGLPLAAAVAPGTVAVADSSEELIATVTGATATVDLLDTVSLQVVPTTGVASITGDRASSSQGLTVAAFDLTLADLLGGDVLAQLPIGVLLDVLGQFPTALPGADGLGAAVLQALDAVTSAVAGVEKAAAELTTAVADAATAAAALADAESTLAALQTDLENAQATQATAEATAAAAAQAVSEIEAALADPLTLAGAAAACIGELDVTACLNALLVTAQADLDAANTAVSAATDAVVAAAAAVDDQLTVVDGLAEAAQAAADLVTTLAATVNQLVSDLVALAQDLLDALGALDGSMTDLLDILATTPLIGVSAMDVTVAAVATGDVSTSLAETTCSDVTLTLVGETVTSRSCQELSEVASAVADLLATVEGVLAALPIGDVVPDVTVSLFGSRAATVAAADDGMVHSRAGVVALDVHVPSITLDPSLLSGALDLSVTDLVAAIEGVLPVSSTLSDAGLAEAAALIDEAIGQVDGALQTVQDGIDTVLAALPVGELPPLTTPGVRVTIDPTATSTFGPAPVAAPAPSQPAPEGEPLPVTGGPSLLIGSLGAAVMTGAAALARGRRRRPW